MKLSATKLLLLLLIFVTTENAGYGQTKIHVSTTATTPVYLFNNQAKTIPLKGLATKKIASINMGSAYALVFDSLLSKYASIKSFESSLYKTDSLHLDNLMGDHLKFYTTLIIQLTAQSLNDPEVIQFITENQKRKELIIAGFGELSLLKKLDFFTGPVIWNTAVNAIGTEQSAQLIFGGIAAKGTLKQTVSAKYKVGAGYATEKTRLRYSTPESVGIRSADLDSIDMIAAEAIREKATPSAVVLVIKDGNVIFNKAYGSHTYDGTMPTKLTDIYDLASVTKVSATTMSAMKLYDQKKIALDKTIGDYIPNARQSNKSDIKIRELLTHQSGVTAVSFYLNLKPEDHSADSSKAYPVKVADGYYFKPGYFQEMFWPAFLRAPLKNRGEYLYTDMNMYVMKEIVEWQSGTPIDNYVQNQFYKPLGMYTAGFLPRNRFEKEQIIPTEEEGNFRKSLLHGYVHDPGASLMGGISGHAGLFASANDLGILYQMMLNKGTYGGERYLKSETVSLFTSKQSATSRRALGFDMSNPDTTKAYPSKLTTPGTYGHTGFTGICVWVDPKNNLIYVFLSNRVHPKITEKLYQLNIRSRIQDVIYRALPK
ncbi:CubicO group peptidase (beta-lactamase class C family) [Pedobacter sp. AK017]|uniref:serine hydrolase domain-containing protein n=1 Tax=Pedobacter sp. AK017 TaxID=2723073 RepID=UPI00160F828A|nr:serine hydrolase [Pedobacter sp. AK017]MBB5441009.1 CubicO group peptidase (beta-lactamase class C family) [Pedobacter sp. AK017]